MSQLRLILCSMILLGSALSGCGDDDGAAGTGGSGGSGGTGGSPVAEGSICDTTDECVESLTCIPTGVTSVDPLFCGRGCERQDQCETGERCSAFCDPTETGCTSNPAYCATLVNEAWAPCGFSITSTCGTTTAGDDLICLVTDAAGSLGFCIQLCEFNTAGQCADSQICSADILGRNDVGVCATPRARGEACDPLNGDVCGATDFCASLIDTTGAGNCRQACGGSADVCGGGTECIPFAQIQGQNISACFPTAGGNQDGGV